MHEVSIFPIFDPDHHPSPKQGASINGCLDSPHIIEAVLPDGAYIDSLHKALGKGDLVLTPGFYLMLEFNEDADEFMGLVFTVTRSGKHVLPFCRSGAERVVSWPPR